MKNENLTVANVTATTIANMVRTEAEEYFIPTPVVLKFNKAREDGHMCDQDWLNAISEFHRTMDMSSTFISAFDFDGWCDDAFIGRFIENNKKSNNVRVSISKSEIVVRINHEEKEETAQ